MREIEHLTRNELVNFARSVRNYLLLDWSDEREGVATGPWLDPEKPIEATDFVEDITQLVKDYGMLPETVVSAPPVPDPRLMYPWDVRSGGYLLFRAVAGDVWVACGGLYLLINRPDGGVDVEFLADVSRPRTTEV